MIRHWRLVVAAVALAACVAALAVVASTDVGGFGGLHGLLRLVNEAQRRLYGELAAAVDALKGPNAAWPLAVLFGVSFIYGVLHAVGPGHGKVVISSYLVASGSQLRRGLALSFAASMVQAASAILLVSVLALVLKLNRLEINNQSILLEEGSYALIVLIGLAMLGASLKRGLGGGPLHDHGRHHAHHADGVRPAAPLDRRRGNWRSSLAVVLATGIRPCSGAILVLLFALAEGVFPAGIAAAVVMAAGTGVTISGLAILAVYSRRTAIKIAGESSHWQSRIHTGLAILSSLFVIAAGLLLLLATAGETSSL
ncbi:MAG: nickel/cobalt transporter [Reyranellales bacterium]